MISERTVPVIADPSWLCATIGGMPMRPMPGRTSISHPNHTIV